MPAERRTRAGAAPARAARARGGEGRRDERRAPARRRSFVLAGPGRARRRRRRRAPTSSTSCRRCWRSADCRFRAGSTARRIARARSTRAAALRAGSAAGARRPCRRPYGEAESREIAARLAEPRLPGAGSADAGRARHRRPVSRRFAARRSWSRTSRSGLREPRPRRRASSRYGTPVGASVPGPRPARVAARRGAAGAAVARRPARADRRHARAQLRGRDRGARGRAAHGPAARLPRAQRAGGRAAALRLRSAGRARWLGALGRLLDAHVPRRADFCIAVTRRAGRPPPARRASTATRSRASSRRRPPDELGRVRRTGAGRPLVCYAGNLDGYQNLDFLLAASRLVRAAARRTRLVLVTPRRRPRPRGRLGGRGLGPGVEIVQARVVRRGARRARRAAVAVSPAHRAVGVPDEAAQLHGRGEGDRRVAPARPRVSSTASPRAWSPTATSRRIRGRGAEPAARPGRPRAPGLGAPRAAVEGRRRLGRRSSTASKPIYRPSPERGRRRVLYP